MCFSRFNLSTRDQQIGLVLCGSDENLGQGPTLGQNCIGSNM